MNSSVDGLLGRRWVAHIGRHYGWITSAGDAWYILTRSVTALGGHVDREPVVDLSRSTSH